MILSIKSWRAKKKLRKPHNSLHHADNRKYFSSLSLTRNRGEAHMFYLAREVRRIWRCSCWEKGNFIMINEFKYVQTWKIWPSPLSLSLYSTFNAWLYGIEVLMCRSAKTDGGCTGDRPLVQCKGLYVLPHSISLHLDLEN